MATTPPPKLWVLLKSNDSAVVNKPVKVPTKDCDDVDDFIEAIKKKLPNKLGHVDSDNITLHLTKDGPALEPDDALPAQNTKQTALVVTIPPSAKSSKNDLFEAATDYLITAGDKERKRKRTEWEVSTLAQLSYNPNSTLFQLDTNYLAKTGLSTQKLVLYCRPTFH
ncbi:hypothetical protein BC833DRAFT_431227, partial [Globomyces pollinis-pini]